MKKRFAFLLLCLVFVTINLLAQSDEEKAVAAMVETLRTLIVIPDQTELENIAAAALSYGHSNGLIENKAAFIDDLVTGKTQFLSVAFTDQTIKIAGDVAVVRNRFTGNPASNPTNKIDIIVLMVWQQQNGHWKLLARQGAKIPATPKN